MKIFSNNFGVQYKRGKRSKGRRICKQCCSSPLLSWSSFSWIFLKDGIALPNLGILHSSELPNYSENSLKKLLSTQETKRRAQQGCSLQMFQDGSFQEISFTSTLPSCIVCDLHGTHVYHHAIGVNPFSCIKVFLLMALIQCISSTNPWTTCAYHHSHVQMSISYFVSFSFSSLKAS